MSSFCAGSAIEACKTNSPSALRQLLSDNPSLSLNKPDEKGRTWAFFLYFSSAFQHYITVFLSSRLLYLASKKGHLEIVKILVEEYGADKNLCTERYSPLDAAKVGINPILDAIINNLKKFRSHR